MIPEDQNKILKEKVLKIIAFISLKGGVAKTTDLLMMATELASKGYKVLIADKDHQCNLTHYFGIYPQKGTIANVYTGGEVDIVSVAPNIDLIPGSMRLDEIERQLETNPNKNVFFYEMGIGLDIYTHYFRVSPSLRALFSVNNELIPDKDANSRWTGNINGLKTRGFLLNLNFE